MSPALLDSSRESFWPPRLAAILTHKVCKGCGNLRNMPRSFDYCGVCMAPARRRQLQRECALPLTRLREHRKRAGLTQANLAARAGVGMSSVSRYERGYVMLDTGKIVPACATLRTARRLAAALDISPVDLVSINDCKQAIGGGWL